MKRKVKISELKKINMEGLYISNSAFDGSLNEDDKDYYIDKKKETKQQIIDALNECDDFTVEFSTDDYWGNECNLITYKVEVESDEDLEKRREKQRIRNKELAERRKRKKEREEKEREENEKKEYERLKKKFENEG
jgi:cell division ATPase FtsA